MKKTIPTVLHVGPAPPQLGGMEAFVGHLLSSNLKNDYNLLLLDISKHKKRSSAYKVPVGYTGSFKRSLKEMSKSYALSTRFFFRFWLMLLTKHIDIVHLHTGSYTSFWEKSLYVLLAKLWRKKIVMHIHGALFQTFYEQSPKFIQWLVRSILALCNAVVVLSKSWQFFFRQLIAEKKITIVSNGIDLSQLQSIRFNKTSHPSIVFLSEVSRRKGIYDLIEAGWRLKGSGLDFQLMIVGGGEIDETKELVSKRQLEKYVTFHGPQHGRDKFAFLKTAWCFVLPSYAEGFPLAIIEAMAFGLPVISTNVGGIPDMLKHGEHGFLCTPGDVDELAKFLKTILTDPSLRTKMGKMNRRLALDSYDINSAALRISVLYENLLSESNPILDQ